MESIDTFACATMTIVLQLTVAILCFMPFSRAHFRRRAAAVLDSWALTCNKGLVDFYQGVIADPTNMGNTDVTGDGKKPAAGREATTKLNSPNPLYPSEN